MHERQMAHPPEGEQMHEGQHADLVLDAKLVSLFLRLVLAYFVLRLAIPLALGIAATVNTPEFEVEIRKIIKQGLTFRLPRLLDGALQYRIESWQRSVGWFSQEWSECDFDTAGLVGAAEARAEALLEAIDAEEEAEMRAQDAEARALDAEEKLAQLLAQLQRD